MINIQHTAIVNNKDGRKIRISNGECWIAKDSWFLQFFDTDTVKVKVQSIERVNNKKCAGIIHFKAIGIQSFNFEFCVKSQYGTSGWAFYFNLIEKA